jgi:hypothetical protein
MGYQRPDVLDAVLFMKLFDFGEKDSNSIVSGLKSSTWKTVIWSTEAIRSSSAKVGERFPVSISL